MSQKRSCKEERLLGILDQGHIFLLKNRNGICIAGPAQLLSLDPVSGHVWPERNGYPILGTQPLPIWFYSNAPTCPMTRARAHRQVHGTFASSSDELTGRNFFLKAK